MGASDNRDHTLTPEAKRLLQEIIEDWSSEAFFRGPQISTDALTEGVEWLYSMSSLPRPQVIVFDSPLGCQMELQAMENAGEDMQTVEVNVWPSIDFKMWSALWWKVMGEFLKYRHSDALSTVEENIIAMTMKAAASIGESVFAFSEDNLLKRYRRVAYYDFLVGSGHVKSENLDHYIRFLRSGCFLSVFIRNHAVISMRPVAIKFNPRGQFHCEDGPAFAWQDGWKAYYLNGVRVSQEVAESPADHMDIKLFLHANNVEVRREIVRKMGAERLIQKLGGKVLDRWNEYELIQIKVPGMGIRPTYLKMKNPSIGTYHVEGVPPQITTCKEALSWRVGGLNWEPEQLT